jgi:FKBP-type peptidyl-prolyl cis-trans isomerase 2
MIPGAENLPVGQTVYFNGPMGPFPAKVVSLDEQNVVLDMNHELAGKDLTFEIELVEVEG